MAIQVTTAGSLQNRPLPLDMARIQREVNWIYRFYQQTLYFDFLRSVPVNIQLLENRAEYIRHVWDTAQWDASKTLGVYMPKTHSIVLYLHDGKNRRPGKYLRHYSTRSQPRHSAFVNRDVCRTG